MNLLCAVSVPVFVSVAVALFVVGLVAGLLVYKIYSSKKMQKNKSNAIKIIEHLHCF